MKPSHHLGGCKVPPHRLREPNRNDLAVFTKSISSRSVRDEIEVKPKTPTGGGAIRTACDRGETKPIDPRQAEGHPSKTLQSGINVKNRRWLFRVGCRRPRRTRKPSARSASRRFVRQPPIKKSRRAEKSVPADNHDAYHRIERNLVVLHAEESRRNDSTGNVPDESSVRRARSTISRRNRIGRRSRSASTRAPRCNR